MIMSRLMIERRHLDLVCAVADEGSLTRAADKLHVTQSALSHRLREAERILRRPLFLRSRRSMDLTPAGRRLLEAARRITAELSAIERDFRVPSDGEGRLRIATECYTCYHWLPGALEAFRRKCPGIDVQVVADATRAPIPALLAGKIDLAIVSDPVRNARVALEPLFRDELVVAMTPAHRLARTRFVAAGDFADETLITYSAPREHLTIFRDVLDPAGIVPGKWIPMELTEAIVEMVKARQGVAVLARWAAAPAVRSGALVVRRLTAPGIVRQWSAATIRRKVPPGHLSEFTRALSACPRHHRGGLAVAM